MRIITGTARGRRLLSPEGEGVRPTSARVKESIFNIIQFEIEGRRVLDLFAGSAQLGIEALSRGAESAVFVERDPAVVQLINKNIAIAGFEKKAKVEKKDSLGFLSVTNDIFDIVFIDPPYEKGFTGKALSLIEPHMAEGGVIICETLDTEALPENAGRFFTYRTYKHSNTMISVYRDR